MIRFKVDENLKPQVAAFLRERGHDAATAKEQGLRGKSDAHVAEVCRREGRVLVTLDKHFSNVRNFPPSMFPGLLVLRLGCQGLRCTLAALARALPQLEALTLEGCLVIVEERSIRVRR